MYWRFLKKIMFITSTLRRGQNLNRDVESEGPGCKPRSVKPIWVQALSFTITFFALIQSIYMPFLLCLHSDYNTMGPLFGGKLPWLYTTFSHQSEAFDFSRSKVGPRSSADHPSSERKEGIWYLKQALF